MLFFLLRERAGLLVKITGKIEALFKGVPEIRPAAIIVRVKSRPVLVQHTHHGKVLHFVRTLEHGIDENPEKLLEKRSHQDGRQEKTPGSAIARAILKKVNIATGPALNDLPAVAAERK